MSVGADDFSPTRFSTDDVSEADRLPRWREEFGRTLVNVDIEPVSPDHPFRGDAIMRTLPGLSTGAFGGTAMHYHRTPALAAGSDGSIGLIVNLAAKAVAAQGSETLALGAGEAVAVMTELPGKLTATNHLGILLPRQAIISRVADLDRAIGRPIPNTLAPLRLLVNYVNLVQDDVRLVAQEFRQTVVNHIHDLAALALGANLETRQGSLHAVAAARLAAALADTNKHYADHDLTLAVLAHRQGVSPRYLQRLFEQSGTSFTARVNELRLQRAFMLLSKPHNRDRPVSEIAWQAGFSNISHFNRLFRARFGDTPTGVRGC